MSTDKKIVLSLIIISIVILIVGSALLLSRETTVTSDDRVVSRNGLHWHPRLKIFIKGQKIELENNIGRTGGKEKPLHTHTEDYKDGIIHLEFDGVVSKEEVKLGKFFKIWGKEFSQTTIFDKENGPEGTVKMFVNDKENFDFQDYEMRDKDNIEIRYE